MARYQVQGPDGQLHVFDGPDGATPDQVIAVAQQTFGARQKIADQIANDPISQGARNFAKDMPLGDQITAGAGKAFNDVIQGVKQKFGGATVQDVVETRRIDAPLMATGGGKAGYIAQNAINLAPAAFIPGAATVPGAAVIGGLYGSLMPSESVGEAVKNTTFGAAGGAAGQAIGNGVGAMLDARSAAKAAQAAQAAQKVGAATAASKAGYVIPPEDIGAGGAVTKVLGGVGGKIKTAQVASQQNQGVTNALAKDALGVPRAAPLDTPTLQGIRSAAGQAYDAIKNTGTVTADSTYANALNAVASKYTTAAQAFPGAVKSEIPELVNALKQPTFSADAAVEMTKILRARGDAAFASGDKGSAKAFKDAADAMEGMLERHLKAQGMPDALKAFQDARATIAKTYTVGKGLNPATGDVSAPALAKLLDNGKPLTGELRTIAEAAQAFPRSMQALKEAPKSISPLDMAFALSKAAGGHGLNLLTLGARPAARSVLLSGPMQRNALAAAGQAPANALSLMRPEDLALPIGATTGNALAYFQNQ